MPAHNNVELAPSPKKGNMRIVYHALAMATKPMTPQELKIATALDRAKVARCIDNMAYRGYLVRDPHSRRVTVAPRSTFEAKREQRAVADEPGSTESKQTTITLSSYDRKRVGQLMLKRGMTMNHVISLAIKSYARPPKQLKTVTVAAWWKFWR